MENVSPSSSTAAPPAPPLVSRTTAIVGVVGILLLAAAAIYIGALHRSSPTLRESSRAIEAHVKTIYLQTQQVEALDRLAVRVDRFNHDFGASLGRLQVSDEPRGRHQGAQGEGPHLPDEAKKTLDEFEQSVAAIDEMSAKVKEYERYLGAPATVKRGDTHSQIVARATSSRRRSSRAQEADEVLKRTALAWELAGQPGLQPVPRRDPALDGHPGHREASAVDGAVRPAPGSRRGSQELEDKLKQCEPKPAPPEGAAAAP